MPVYKSDNGTWYVLTRYLDWKGERKQKCKRGFETRKMAKKHIFIGAYDGDKCIGLAILRHDMFKYMYLYDLKVNAEYRSKGVGKMLIDESKKVAKDNGYIGVYTQGQDNNLGACHFYLGNGFEIGGLNTHVYNGTSQENKKDIFFYYTNK